MTARGQPAEPLTPALLKAPEAADYLGVSLRFVQNETAAGNLPVVRLGRPGSRKCAVRYLRADLDEYIARRRVETVRASCAIS